MDHYEIPHQIRYPQVRTLADSKTSCPTIVNERSLRSRETKPSAATLKNQIEELGHWQKLRKKFSREHLSRRTEESKLNLEMSGVEMTNCSMGDVSDMSPSEVEVPLSATVLFPAPEQRTSPETLNSDIYRSPNIESNFEKLTNLKKRTILHKVKGCTLTNEAKEHRKMDNGKNEETTLQEMTSTNTIEVPDTDKSYAKLYKRLYKTVCKTQNTDSECESDIVINVEEKKTLKVKLHDQDTHSQQQREGKSKKVKSQSANENHSSESENDITEKRKNNQKNHITKVEEEPSITEEVNIIAESDCKCSDNSLSVNEKEKSNENKMLNKLTRSNPRFLAISGDEDYCSGRTPTLSLTNILYEMCTKQTTASNMAMVFPFVMFCSVMLWVVNSLYYTQFSDPLEEKLWYEFAVNDWVKLLQDAVTDYLESIILPVPVK